MKKLIVFDLDGTLAQSKAALDADMAQLFGELLNTSKVAIISGGAWPQFEKQVLHHLPKGSKLKNLSILPTCGTQYYKYGKKWKKLYSEDFTADEKKTIIDSLNRAIEQTKTTVKKTWGEQIEDRGSQITWSALGQQAPLNEKEKWDPDFAKRKKIKDILDKSLKGFSVQMGGSTSIDITKPGIDKAYGIHKLKEITGVRIKQMLFVGDALFEGGNDSPARKTGVVCVQVRDPDETKRVIETFIACCSEKHVTTIIKEKK